MTSEVTMEHGKAGGRFQKWIMARLTTLSYVYLTGLGTWAILRFFFQDRWAWLFLISGPAVYLFLPLPLILLIALLGRKHVLLVGFVVGSTLWVALYGGLFLPKSATAQAGESSLTVMTYNLMGHNRESGPVVEVLRASNADVIALGELNPEIAAALEADLIDLYPYQVLTPQRGVSGAGVISRYPLQLLDESLPVDYWVGPPQVLSLDFDGTIVTLLNFHAIPMGTTTGDVTGLNWSVRKREEQAQAIVDFAAIRQDPVIIFGDLNASDQHKAYRILTAELVDSWREAGWGLGHTFPGSASRFSSRPQIFGIHTPKWMIRIDYIFHSQQWQAESAWIGSWDRLSDHRPVVTRLRLVR